MSESVPGPAANPFPIAVGGIVLVAIALVLLALGGVVVGGSPATFDLWMLAIGLYVLVGAMLGLGPSLRRGDPSSRVTSDHASLAEAPALTIPSPDPKAGRPAPRVRSGLPPTTMAGQYYEVARGSPRRVAPRWDEDFGYAPGVPYAPMPRRPASPPPPPNRPPDAPAGSGELEREIERLRARVAELESSPERAKRPTEPPPATEPP